MRTKRKQQKVLIGILIFCLVIMYQFLPIQKASAVSLKDAKNVISDSDLGVTNVTHTITFTTSTSTPINDYFEVVFPAGFTNILVGGVTCSNAMAKSVLGQVVTCKNETAGAIEAGTKTITVSGVTNPGTAGYKLFKIYHKANGGAVKENVQVMVFIIEDVLMSATVDPTLNFIIEGLNAGTTVNGVNLTATSTATTTPFGTLGVLIRASVGQRLKVGTNADDGYVVTVWQDQELTSGSNSNINSFNNALNGTGSSTVSSTWLNPIGTLDATNTYGHMGLTTNDTGLPSAIDFTGSKYVGFNNTDPVQVMSHDGPCNEITPGKCLNDVAYTVEITALQEAGDYYSTLTYICTAQY